MPSTINPIADAQQHCVAVIKQEAKEEEEDDRENENDITDNNIDHNSNDDVDPSVQDLSMNNDGQDPHDPMVTLQQQTKHFRQQHEEIVNRLHKAVTDNLKLINQNTETACNGNSFISNGSKQQDESSTNHNMNLNMQQRFCVRTFNGNTSDLKLCRLSKSKLSNAIQQHQLHASDLFSSLIDSSNDDNNNSSNNDLILNEDNNHDSNYLLPCPLCEIPLEPRLFRQHLDRHYPRDSPICPVLQCGRRFAHPNSVRNHMRLKHTVQWNRMKSMRSSGGPFSSLPY